MLITRERNASFRRSSPRSSPPKKSLAEAVFAAARCLYEGGPWKHVSGEAIIRVDVPSLDVDGACLSVIGTRAGDRGFALFPSADAYDEFALAMQGARVMSECRDFGTSWLHLLYVPMDEYPLGVRRAIRSNALPIANRDAVPSLQSHDRWGRPKTLTEREIWLMGTCAASLSQFLNLLDGACDPLTASPTSVQLEHDDFPPVRMTFPYEMNVLFSPPSRNAQGHRWAVTTDRYEFETAQYAEVQRLLLAVPEVRDDAPQDEDGAHVLMLVRGQPTTRKQLRAAIIGSMELRPGSLEVTADSVERADEARRLVERGAGAFLKFVARDVVGRE